MKNKQTVREILENWLDDALATSIWAVSPLDGYKGELNEKKMEKLREKDYDKAISKAEAQLKAMLLGAEPKEPKSWNNWSIERQLGYNQAIEDFRANINNLFGGKDEL